jgi:hypothetical protein
MELLPLLLCCCSWLPSGCKGLSGDVAAAGSRFFPPLWLLQQQLLLLLA